MKKYFLTGLIILLPLVLTIAIFGFIVNFLTKPFMGMMAQLLSSVESINHGIFIFSAEQTLRYVSQFVILISLLIAVFLLGMLARWFLVRWILTLGEKILHKLPVVNLIYKTTKDIVVHLFNQGGNTFRQVVLVPFPGPDIYAIGLLSEKGPKECLDKLGEDLLSVFVPTAPNPVVIYKRRDIIFLDMKPEDAIKYVVSCGVVTPETEPKRHF